MTGSPTYITPQQFKAGWDELQEKTRAARQAFEQATTATAIAESFTELSRHRLLAFGQLTLHRAQRIERLTAGALLSHSDFGLVADKDVDVYRIFRLVPLLAPAREVLNAVRADIQALREKCEEAGIRLRGQLGKAGWTLPRRTCLFFGLRVDPTDPARLLRCAQQKGSLDELAQSFWGQPANVGRHFFISEMLSAGVDPSALAAVTGQAFIGAEPFSDSMGLAPAALYSMARQAMTSLVERLALAPVAGPFLSGPVSHASLAAAPDPASDPYSTQDLGRDGRILPPAIDSFTLPCMVVIERVWSMLTQEASFPGLGAAEATLCAVALDGLHPSDLDDAGRQMPATAYAVGKAACLTFRRPGCHAEISIPLCARTALAIKASRPGPIGDQARFAAAGRWVQEHCDGMTWPEDPVAAFLAFHSCAARFHRFHSTPATLAAASRGMPASAANRESMLRLAGNLKPMHTAPAEYTPVKVGSARVRVRSRQALKDLQQVLGTEGNTRARRGEEQARARKLDRALGKIDVQGDRPAACAVEVLRIECSFWLDSQRRAAKDGRQFSTLATYGTEVFAALRMLSPGEDLGSWDAPDFVEWHAQVARTHATPDDAATELFGMRRFLLVGRDYLGWDVPDALLSAESPYKLDGKRRSAAASLLLASDYAAAGDILRERLKEWPEMLKPALLELALRQHVSSRSGERCTLEVDCMTHESGHLVFRNAGFSDKKSTNAIRLCRVPGPLAESIATRAATPDALGGLRTHLFLGAQGDDWAVADAVQRIVTDALVMATRDASVRPHSSRAAAACAHAFAGWEMPARAILAGQGVSAAVAWPEPAAGNHVVQAALEMGVGHARTFLVYYCPAWPLLCAIEVNRLLARHRPTPSFISAALGDTQAVRAARSRAERRGEPFNEWDVIGRLAVERAGLPPLVVTSPSPVLAPAVASTRAPAANAVARYVLARKTGTQCDVAAQAYGIPLHIAEAIDTQMEEQ